MIDRNERKVFDLVCRFKGYWKVCKSKGGVFLHQEEIHRPLMKESGLKLAYVC